MAADPASEVESLDVPLEQAASMYSATIATLLATAARYPGAVPTAEASGDRLPRSPEVSMYAPAIETMPRVDLRRLQSERFEALVERLRAQPATGGPPS